MATRGNSERAGGYVRGVGRGGRGRGEREMSAGEGQQRRAEATRKVKESTVDSAAEAVSVCEQVRAERLAARACVRGRIVNTCVLPSHL